MRIFTHKGWLDPLGIDHAEPLFQLIHHSRSHLYPWLPWLKRIHSPQDTAAFILKLLAERGPQFVINVDRHVCGGLGFYCLENAEKKATMGYWLGNEYTGQGIMVDAVRHLCHFGFHHLNLQKIEIRCAAQNHGSRKVPERLGFYLEGVQHKAEWLSDRYVDHAVYSILKDEFTVAYVADSMLGERHFHPAISDIRPTNIHVHSTNSHVHPTNSHVHPTIKSEPETKDHSDTPALDRPSDGQTTA